MAVIDAVETIATLNARDAEAALRLSREAGWNQSVEDWRVFLRDGTVFGVRDSNGALIATAALLPYPPVTWISMVLVTGQWQRRGLAARLMQRCLDEARNRGLVPWLDATPAGAAVYSGIGFRNVDFGLQRWRLTRGGATDTAPSHAGAPIDRLLAADRDAMHLDRGLILRQLAERQASRIWNEKGAAALVRDGDRARHIGPVFASDQAAAGALLERIVATEAGALLIDVAADRTGVVRCVEQLGFTFERPFNRMVFGTGVVQLPSAALMAAAGPEFG